MWRSITEQRPPIDRVIWTKIIDVTGERNVQELKFDGRLWWIPGANMYVYYEPTHWYDAVFEKCIDLNTII